MAETESKEARHLRRHALVDWLCGVTGCIAWVIFLGIVVMLIW